MLATLVIFLREGIEASMIVAILLAYLDRLGRRDHFKDVFLGVGAALLIATGGGVAAYLTIRSYDGSRVQTIFETATFIVAAAVLTYMTFWMRGHARSMSAELRSKTDAALDGRARWGLALLAFQAVGREGLETVVFTLAIIFSTSTANALTGAVIGLAGALVIAFFIYRLGHKLNLAKFFTVIGCLLMVFAAGLLADTVENLQELGWVRVLDEPMWHTGRILSEDSSFGDVLHSFFGYSDSPTPLQLIVYVAYLADRHRRLSRPAAGRAHPPAAVTACDRVVRLPRQGRATFPASVQPASAFLLVAAPRTQRLAGVLFQFLESGLPDLLMLLMGSAQLVVGGVLEREQRVVRFREHPQDLVQLALGCRLMARLRVLDDKHHDQRDRGDQRLENPLPLIREVEDRAQGHPANPRGQHAHRRQRSPRVPVDAPQQPAAPGPPLLHRRQPGGRSFPVRTLFARPHKAALPRNRLQNLPGSNKRPRACLPAVPVRGTFDLNSELFSGFTTEPDAEITAVNKSS